MNSIKKLRIKKHLTQKELAKKIGVSDASINKYEKNIMIPKIDKLEKMAEVFNVSVDYITGKNAEDLTRLPNTITIKIEEYERLKCIEERYNAIIS